MMRRLFTFARPGKTNSRHYEIDPDEIFLDSSNLPNFDVHQFEGRLERPISRRALFFAGMVFALICVVLATRTWYLQVPQGNSLSALAERNSLHDDVIIAPRGLIQDRNGVSLVTNKANDAHSEYPSREYTKLGGMSHLLGYVEYPKKDSSGIYYRFNYDGKDGIEEIYNDLLAGKNGTKITEKNATGGVESESVLEPPRYGLDLTLSIDSRLQNTLYGYMKSLAAANGFTGGAAVVMDIHTGELIAVTSYPDFDPTVMSEGNDSKAIQSFLSDSRQPFLDRAVSGLYTPGSIVKPFVAVGALTEKVISPTTKILSTGSISIPNPYDPTKTSVFKDWRAQGWVDMRTALAVSSDVYFYEVGGGFEDQPGLGIANIKKYMQLFGFGTTSPGNFLLNTAGTLPDPAWKTLNFNDEPWRIGDTYNTAIGQYGMQVTPLQVVRAVAALANGGYLVEPTVIHGGNGANRTATRALGISPDDLTVVQEGMRDSVLFGTASNLNIPQVQIAAKTGTAQLGAKKQTVNSWVEGFFPYQNPRYAFAAIMESGPADNTVGALYVMRQFFEWLGTNASEYLQ